MLGGLTAANAQIEPGEALRIDVPHSFVVRDKTLPAGKYTITPIEESDGSTHLLKLQSQNGKEVAVFDTTEKILNEPYKNTELVFKQTGDEYVLTEIRIKGEEQANDIPETKSEKRAVAVAVVN
jgi:hypothetical protein